MSWQQVHNVLTEAEREELLRKDEPKPEGCPNCEETCAAWVFCANRHWNLA